MKKILCSILTITLLLIFSVPVFASKQDSTSNKEIKVINNLNGKSINNEKVALVIAKAEEYYVKESQKKTKPFTFNYTMVGEEISYLYEKTSNGKSEILVFPTTKNTENIPTNNEIITLSIPVDIPDGIGGRVKMFKNGNILTTSVETATESQVSVPDSGMAYLYVGFSGKNGSNQTVESDIGLQWSEEYTVWKPYFLYNDGSDDNGYFVDEYNEVQYKNGYIPGETINFTLYKNYNGKIRFKTEGYALHEDRLGNGGTTWLISVIESNTTANMGTISYWKVLATIAGEDTGQVYGKFENIKIDGTAAPLSEPEVDNASVTVNSNNATIYVDSDAY